MTWKLRILVTFDVMILSHDLILSSNEFINIFVKWKEEWARGFQERWGVEHPPPEPLPTPAGQTGTPNGLSQIQLQRTPEHQLILLSRIVALFEMCCVVR